MTFAPRLFRSARSEPADAGAVMVLFSAFIVVAIVFAAFVIDIGSLRAARASLENATDSAALAAGQGFADGGDGCEDDADRLLRTNDADAELISCTWGTNGDGTGWVTVEAERSVEFRFGPVVGVDSGSTGSTTSVLFNTRCEDDSSACGSGPTSASLKPIGMCAPTALLEAWRDLGRPTPWSPVEIAYGEEGTGCGITTGEFLVVDFDGGNSPTSDIQDWNRNGFPGTISVGDQLLTDQRVITHGDGYDGLVGEVVAVALYDQLVAGGPGGNETFVVVSGFVIAEVVAVDDTSRREDRSITLSLVAEITTGSCCNATEGGGDSDRILAICDVDGTMLDNCTTGKGDDS